MFHFKQAITNFCIDPDCFMPLCPQCVEEHLDQHRLKNSSAESHIKTFEHVKIHSLETLKGFIEELKNHKREIERGGISPEDLQMQLLKDLEISKGRVMAVVEGVFAEVKKTLETELFQATGFFDIREQMNKIGKKMHDLQKAADTIIEGGQKALKKIIVINNKGIFSDTARFLEESRGAQNRYLGGADFRILENPEELNNLTVCLRRFLTFSSKNAFGSHPPIPTPPTGRESRIRGEDFKLGIPLGRFEGGPLPVRLEGGPPLPLQTMESRVSLGGPPMPLHMSAIQPRNVNFYQPAMMRYPSPGYRVAQSALAPRQKWAEI